MSVVRLARRTSARSGGAIPPRRGGECSAVKADAARASLLHKCQKSRAASHHRCWRWRLVRTVALADCGAQEIESVCVCAWCVRKCAMKKNGETRCECVRGEGSEARVCSTM